MNFPVIDIIFAALVLLFIMRGLTKGFFGEVFSVAAVVLGLLAALLYTKPLSVILQEYMTDTTVPGSGVIPTIAAFIILFVIVFIFVKILENILKGILAGIRLGGVDKFLGLILGAVEGLIVVCFILFLLKLIPFFDSDAFLADSFFARLLMPLIDAGARGKFEATTAWLSRAAASV